MFLIHTKISCSQLEAHLSSEYKCGKCSLVTTYQEAGLCMMDNYEFIYLPFHKASAMS